jgi:steroid delta-isomerase-like uncharacterized protein
MGALSSHEVEQRRPFLLPESRYEDVPTATVSSGVDAVIDFFRRVWTAIPDMQMAPTHMLQTAEGVAVEWLATGTHLGDFPGLPATGNPFRVRGISMIEVAGAWVRRVSDYWDRASSGLLPRPAPNGEAASARRGGRQPLAQPRRRSARPAPGVGAVRRPRSTLASEPASRVAPVPVLVVPALPACMWRGSCRHGTIEPGAGAVLGVQ